MLQELLQCYFCLISGMYGTFIPELLFLMTWHDMIAMHQHGAQSHSWCLRKYFPATSEHRVMALALLAGLLASAWPLSSTRSCLNQWRYTTWPLDFSIPSGYTNSLFKSRTYFLFAGLNLLWIPTIYLCEHCPIITRHKPLLTKQFTLKPATGRLNLSKHFSQRRAHSTGRWSRRSICKPMSWWMAELVEMTANQSSRWLLDDDLDHCTNEGILYGS